MKSLTQSIRLTHLFIIGLVLFAYLFGDQVFAASSGISNPLEGVEFGGSSNTNDLAGTISFWLSLGLVVLIAAALIFGLADSIQSLFTSLSEARRSGEWGNFMKQFVFILIAIVVALMVGYFAFVILNNVIKTLAEL